jgi:hypothetical protein
MSLKDQVIEQFHEKTNKLFLDTLNVFKKKSADLILDGSGWGE